MAFVAMTLSLTIVAHRLEIDTHQVGQQEGIIL